MEFMLYGDLKTYLLARRHLVRDDNRDEVGEVSDTKLTQMSLDVAMGLSYLADQKYVHRDVAARNCLVNSARRVKLADFGMTRAMYESDYYRFSRKGMLPVRWMSPESLSDGLFTPMSDIWSFGVLLYEVITFGSFPFQGLSNNQVLSHVKAGNTLNVPQGIKEQLSLLLKTCWHQSPSKRPTAVEILDLFCKNPRLVSPCIDVPLASVQIERTDSLEMIPKSRKPSDIPTQKLRGPLAVQSKGKVDMGPDEFDQGYSTMNGTYKESTSSDSNKTDSASEPLLECPSPEEWQEDCEQSPYASPVRSNLNLRTSESDSPYTTYTDTKFDEMVGSYVPSGYILLDQANASSEYVSNFHTELGRSSV